MNYILYYHDHLGNKCYLRKHRTLEEALDYMYKLYLKMRLLDEDIIHFEYITNNECEVEVDIGNQRSLIIRKEGY